MHSLARSRRRKKNSQLILKICVSLQCFSMYMLTQFCDCGSFSAIFICSHKFNNFFLSASALPMATITAVPVVATGQPFRMSCDAAAQKDGTFSYSWPQSSSGTLESGNKHLRFVSASKALATVPFSCQVTLVQTGRMATANASVIVLGKS